jgi:hypothetical protein
MTTHTPGPWTVRTTVIGPESSIKIIAPKGSDWSDQSIICMVPETSEEQVKNTALITAAPDLLAALEMVARIWSHDQTNNLDSDSPLSIVRAAVIKAGGAA